MNSNRLFAILMATTMSATVFAETETESNTKAVEQTEASKLNRTGQARRYRVECRWYHNG